MNIKTRQTGKLTEAIAAEFLSKHELIIVDKNFSCRFGEIDLVATERDFLVFVEVRYRKQEHFMSAAESIDRNKINKLISASQFYLSKNRKLQNMQCRFDFIGITGELAKPRIEWVKDAFQT